MYSISAEQLRSFIDRIERLEQEKTNLSSDIKDLFAEAKHSGFDTKTMKQIIRIRKMDQEDVREQEALLDLYMNALKMKPGDASA